MTAPTSSAAPTNSIYSVPPWGERYHQTQRQKRGNFDGYPCAICGKDIPTAKANRHGGIITIDGDWTIDPITRVVKGGTL